MRNKNLISAKKAKNDEFYTQLADIERECFNYKDLFRDKVIYCNCDDARESNFFRYFSMNFEFFGLKRLITTGYKSNGHGVALIYEGDKNGNRVVDDEEIQVVELEGNGDFRSPECIEFLRQADIVVTNPPFSHFRIYVDQLMNYNKKFLIIGNYNAVTYKEIFPLIKDNKIWLGIHSNVTMEFAMPDSYEIYDRIENGVKIGKVPSICWFTNLPNKKRTEPLDLYKKYDPNEYLQYDNYNAINVNKVADIPMDYEVERIVTDEELNKLKEQGFVIEIIEEYDLTYKVKIKNPVMGVPITFLNNYNPEQFEIVSFRKGEDGKDLVFTRERERVQPYFRILVRLRLRG